MAHFSGLDVRERSWPVAVLALLGTVIVLAVYLAIPWMAEVCATTTLEAGKTLLKGPGGCIEFWFNRYQTFASALVALGAALISVYLVSKQIRIARRQTALIVQQAAVVAKGELLSKLGHIDGFYQRIVIAQNTMKSIHDQLMEFINNPLNYGNILHPQISDIARLFREYEGADDVARLLAFPQDYDAVVKFIIEWRQHSPVFEKVNNVINFTRAHSTRFGGPTPEEAALEAAEKMRVLITSEEFKNSMRVIMALVNNSIVDFSVKKSAISKSIVIIDSVVARPTDWAVV